VFRLCALTGDLFVNHFMLEADQGAAGASSRKRQRTRTLVLTASSCAAQPEQTAQSLQPATSPLMKPLLWLEVRPPLLPSCKARRLSSSPWQTLHL
jgi:hypothetical protein